MKTENKEKTEIDAPQKNTKHARKPKKIFFDWNKFLLVEGFAGGMMFFSDRHASVNIDDMVMVAFLVIGGGIGFGFMHHLSD